MNILVTGGAGFIGSHIVDAYLEDGHQVVVVDNLSTGDKKFVSPQARFYETDILSPEMSDILIKENIQVINHHAAQISVQESVKDPVFDANSNILGTLQILQYAVGLGVEKFIFASTGGALYGEPEVFPAPEIHPCRPVSPYAVSKLSVEHYLRFFELTYGLKHVVLRYANVFGPRQNPHGEAGVVAIHCNRLLNGEAPRVFGDGEQTRDFVSVRDLVSANRIALKPECQGIYNVGTGRETSVNTLTKELLRISGSKQSIDYQPAKPGEQRRSAISYEKIKAEHGWQPSFTLEEGLIETLEYFKT